MKPKDIEQIEQALFKPGNPLKTLSRTALELFDAEQVGILYGTNDSKIRFLPTSLWDRGVMDTFDGQGVKGLLLKWFGTYIVTIKKLSPVYFYKYREDDTREEEDGVISYMLRTCADYYRKGISIIFSPDISANIYKINEQYAEIPFYSYDGKTISEPDIRVRVNLGIIKHFKAKNYLSVYIPDYGIMVLNTVSPELMELQEHGFEKEAALKEKFDFLIQLVEIVSLAALGQVRGKRGAHLLWKKEKQLRQTSHELVENEQKYRDLYENAPVAYFSCDGEGILTKCNKATVKLTGYSKEELAGRPLRTFYVEEDTRNTSPDDVRSMLDQGRNARDLEMKIRNKAGKDVWVSLSLDAMRDGTGTVTEIRAMAMDISQRKILEKQLLYAQKMEAIGTLAGGIAHDFNNILSPISGYAEMLLMDSDDLSAKRKEHLEIIYDCAKYAKGLVNQMLTFSKQKENQFQLLQPYEFVQEAMTLAGSFLPSTIEVQCHINQECGLIRVDPIQVHQVMMNLISNAYHAMEEKGGVLEIVLDEIQVDEESAMFPMIPGTYVFLKISDTGPGMPPETLERIFDPFFTTKEEGKGSGIGLSVVHGIIQSHEGYINVSSKVGSGSVFEIYLPVYSGDEQASPVVKQQVSEPSSQEIERGTERILLVDDDKKVAFMVQHMLEKLGYQVTCRLNATSAYETFAEHPDRFDLVITDLTMPDLSGCQLAKKITALRDGLPVILCTGFGEHTDKRKLVADGIKGFLNKPIAVGETSRTIRAVLNQRNAT